MNTNHESTTSMREFGGWIAVNWKPVAAMVSAILTLAFGAVQKIETTIEDLDEDHTAEIAANTDSIGAVSSKLDQLRASVGEIRCMLVIGAENGDPLTCVDLDE